MTVLTRRPRALQRVRGLEFNSLSLVVAGLANSALGLVFWALAARMFPASQVGVAGAVINTAVMLATLSNLSLGPLYERFLPQAGRRARGAIAAGTTVTVLLALAIGTGFVLIGPSGDLFDTPTAAMLFPVCVAVLAAFSLADSILIGLRIARWAAAKNLAHAIAKLAVLVVLGWSIVGASDTASMSGTDALIVASVVPAAVAVAIVQAVIVMAGRALPARSTPTMPGARALWSYFGSSFGITVLASITPLVLPLAVVVHVGAAQTAYFTVTWTIVAAVLMATGMIAGPLISEVAAEPERLAFLLRRFLRLFALVTVASTAAMAVAGPVALWLVGSDYLAHGWPLLLWMSLVPIVGAPAIVYAVLCRVHRTMRFAVALQIASTVGVVTCALILIPAFGIIGIGYTFVGVETVISLAALAPLIRRLRTDLADTTEDLSPDAG